MPVDAPDGEAGFDLEIMPPVDQGRFASVAFHVNASDIAMNTLDYSTRYFSVVGDSVMASFPGQRTAVSHLSPSGGTLRFGDGVIGNSCSFVLAGGTLAVDDAATNVCQSLAVGASGGIIRLGAGASLSFGDCREQVWAQDAVVTVSGDLTQSKLRFGTSPAALTHQQLKRIAFEGDGDAAYSAVLDDNGYLNKTAKSGLIVILR